MLEAFDGTDINKREVLCVCLLVYDSIPITTKKIFYYSLLANPKKHTERLETSVHA